MVVHDQMVDRRRPFGEWQLCESQFPTEQYEHQKSLSSDDIVLYYMNVVQLFYMFLYVNIGGLLGFYQAYRVETAGFCGPRLGHVWATSVPGLDGQMVSAVDRKGAMDDVHRLTFILAARRRQQPCWLW